MEHESGGLVRRIIRPVPEKYPRAAQPLRTTLDEGTYRNRLRASYGAAGAVE